MKDDTISPIVDQVTISVRCQCGDLLHYEIELDQDDSGKWSVPIEERFIFCDECERVMDAGDLLSIEVAP